MVDCPAILNPPGAKVSMKSTPIRTLVGLVLLTVAPGCVVVHTDRVVLIEPSYSHVDDPQTPQPTTANAAPAIETQIKTSTESQLTAEASVPVNSRVP